MILHDVCIYGSSERKHIHIGNGFIKTIATDRQVFNGLEKETRIELNGAIVLPGFINSHDHLDFNLFPAIANRVYNNYTVWGNDIHVTNAGEIKAVQQVPLELKIQWGLYKNLVNGFTTVVNHGTKLATDNSLVNVFQDCHSLHSASFEKYWKWKLNNPFAGSKKFVMHAGEGTDELSRREVDKVIRANYFKRKIVAVHGVTMNTQQASSFEGLVWCPASNLFLFSKTAEIDKLKDKTKIVFGTDSTLTSPWSISEHFNQALAAGMATHKELLCMLTSTAAQLWGLEERGQIKVGGRADILVVNSSNEIFRDFHKSLLLLIAGGEVRVLADKMNLYKQMSVENGFDRIGIKGNSFYVKKGIIELTHQIKSFYPGYHFPLDIN